MKSPLKSQHPFGCYAVYTSNTKPTRYETSALPTPVPDRLSEFTGSGKPEGFFTNY